MVRAQRSSGGNRYAMGMNTQRKSERRLLGMVVAWFAMFAVIGYAGAFLMFLSLGLPVWTVAGLSLIGAFGFGFFGLMWF